MLDGARTPLPVPPPSRPAPGQAGGRGPCGGGGDDDTYRAFLEAKKPSAVSLGFDVDAAEINPALKDFVRAIVQWAAAGGRRGILSSFGLHKTSTQIELARLARKKTGALPLIIVPLGVRHEFFDEAQARFTGAHGVELRFIRSSTEIDPADLTDGSLQEAGSAERDRDDNELGRCPARHGAGLRPRGGLPARDAGAAGPRPARCYRAR